MPVAVVNPCQVRNFAKASGQWAKTDALDARVLAHFAEAIRPQVRDLPDAQARHSMTKVRFGALPENLQLATAIKPTIIHPVRSRSRRPITRCMGMTVARIQSSSCALRYGPN